MKISRFVVLGAAGVAACAAPPLGPMVQVVPGPNKPFEQFQADDANCRGFANAQVYGQAQMANQQAMGGAVLSTVLGAGFGAAVGGGRGAAVGAATGAGLGAGIGAGSSERAQGGIQYQYDNAYAQCMYARGNQVPGFAPPPGAYPPPPGAYAPAGMPLSAAPVPERDRLTQAVQVELNRLGYLNGPADGIPGPQTVGAIQSFQASHGMPVDGVPSPDLLDQMRSIPTRY